MALVDVELDSVGAGGRLPQHHDTAAVVGEHALDVEKLGAAGEPEEVDERGADRFRALVIAAVRSLAVEVEHAVGRQVLECRGQVRGGERVVGVSDPLDIRVLCHGVLPSSPAA